MQTKTIKQNIKLKLEDWLSSITDIQLAKDLKPQIVVSGGCIASMLLNEPVNDYDIYIKDRNVLLRLVQYYTEMYGLEIFDGNLKDQYIKKYDQANSPGAFEFGHNSYIIAVRTLKQGQIKIDTPGYRVPEIPKEKKDPNMKYVPQFFSPNAISLSDDIQIVNRFWGSVEEIHKTFDFIHATNYFTFEDGVVTNKEALESLLTKRLKYQGSLYPLTSIIRSKKFVKRGWNIGAGEYLKIMFQISELNLKDPDVLEDQLIGVDVAYFATIINILRGKFEEDKNFNITATYLNTLIERVFGE